jgi:predicted ATPase
MLSKIRLQRFKKFENVDIQLRPFTVLMGENSSGKTTILQSINFALQGLHALYARNLIIVKNGVAQIADRGIVYYLDQLPGINISKVGELYYGGKASTIPAYIELTDQQNNVYRLQVISRFGTFNFKCVSNSDDLKNQPILHLSQPLLISGFVGLKASEERAFPKAIQNRVQTGRMSEIIRNVVLDIEKQSDGKIYKQLSSLLNRYFNFDIDEVKFDEVKDLYITASFSEIRDNKRISLDLNSSGSGLLQVLQILAPIYRFASKDTVVLLDEPDAHLHTNLQYTLAQALRDVQNELGIQIIISTHSIPMIEAAESSEVVPVYSQAQQIEPLTDKVEVDEAIANLIDNYHLAKAKISGKILFVEDEKIDIFKGFDRALQAGCFLGVNTIPVVPGDGKDNKAPFYSKKTLKEYTKRDIEIHFIVDGDAMPHKWREHFAKYAESKLILHQLVRHEIENYLLTPELLVRALKARFPRKEQDIPSAEDLRSLLTNIMKETISSPKAYFKDHIKKRIENLLALNRRVVEKVIDEETGQEKEEIKNYSPDQVEREARTITEIYLDYADFEQLVLVAPGKETLKKLNTWLIEHKGMQISIKSDIVNCLTSDDVPDEIKQIFLQLRSQAIEHSNGPRQQRSDKKKD